ncbi:MAG: hypothetical protein MUF81_07355 [Verrucomicrobia bacterium]|nr:hypothetical protein [Verrucomicrobiota bacterium]
MVSAGKLISPFFRLLDLFFDLVESVLRIALVGLRLPQLPVRVASTAEAAPCQSWALLL